MRWLIRVNRQICVYLYVVVCCIAPQKKNKKNKENESEGERVTIYRRIYNKLGIKIEKRGQNKEYSILKQDSFIIIHIPEDICVNQ